MAPSVKSSIFSILHVTQWVAHVHHSLGYMSPMIMLLLKSQFIKSTSWSVVNSVCCFCSTFEARWFILTARPWWCTPALITALERWRLSRRSEFKLSLGHKRHNLKNQYITVYSYRCSPFLIQSIDSKQSPTYPVRKLKGQGRTKVARATEWSLMYQEEPPPRSSPLPLHFASPRILQEISRWKSMTLTSKTC